MSQFRTFSRKKCPELIYCYSVLILFTGFSRTAFRLIRYTDPSEIRVMTANAVGGTHQGKSLSYDTILSMVCMPKAISGMAIIRLMSKDENENFISCSISLRLLEPKVLRMAISRLRWAMK